MHQWTWSTLVQIMACRLSSTKPLSNADFLSIGTLGISFSEILIGRKKSYWSKCIWNCCLRKVGHFVSASMSSDRLQSNCHQNIWTPLNQCIPLYCIVLYCIVLHCIVLTQTKIQLSHSCIVGSQDETKHSALTSFCKNTIPFSEMNFQCCLQEKYQDLWHMKVAHPKKSSAVVVINHLRIHF